MIQQGGRLENVPKITKYGFTFQRKFPRDKLRSASWRILMYLIETEREGEGIYRGRERSKERERGRYGGDERG